MMEAEEKDLPVKQSEEDAAFYALLNTIIRGDEYDYETVVLLMNDFAGKARETSPRYLELFYHALEKLVEHPQKNVGHDPSETCCIFLCNSNSAMDKINCLRIFEKIIKKGKKNPSYASVMEKIDLGFWINLIRESNSEDKFYQESLELCRMLSMKSESMGVLRNIVEAVEEVNGSMKEAEGFFDKNPEFFRFVAIGLTMVGVFTKAKDKGAATYAKEYIKKCFAENMQGQSGSEVETLLAPMRKLLPVNSKKDPKP